MRRMPLPRRLVAGALAATLLAAGCSSGGINDSGSSSAPASPTPDSSAASSPPPSTASSTGQAPSTSTATPVGPATPIDSAQAALAAMSEAQRVGQLLMVSSSPTQVDAAAVSAIVNDHVGGVILVDKTSYLGVTQTAAISAQLQRQAPAATKLFIATDQEGGEVQRLQGPGFSSIPSALSQGSISPSTLQADAKKWGGQLGAAGVNVNLGPVLDTVPAGFGSNPPIGDLDREYGHTPSKVTSHGIAVVKGFDAAGIASTIKHFPGLGRVTGNTDTSSGVTDDVTTRHDAYLAPYAAAVQAGTPFVMMSTAIYARIDASGPAAFSSTIVTGMLRGDLGFQGVIISDDLGSAAQVSGYSVGSRAVDFVAAGGDIVLTVDADQAGPMTKALLAKAKSDPAFKAKVDAAALTVLREKQNLGLLH